MSPLSSDPAKQAKQLANLRKGSAPGEGEGNANALRHGLRTVRPSAAALGPAVAAVVAELEPALPTPLRDPDTGAVAPWARETVHALAVMKVGLLRAERWIANEEDHGRPVDLAVLEQQSKLVARYRQALAEEAMTLRSRIEAGIDAMRAVDLATAMSEPDPAIRGELLRRAGYFAAEELGQ